MKSLKALISTCLVVLTVSSAFSQGSGKIHLDSVDGSVGGNMLLTGQPIKFNLAMQNLYGGTVSGFENRFIIYSPDGATWTTTNGNFVGAINTFNMILILGPEDNNGVTPDFITFSGLGPQGGIPNGFDQVSLTIDIGPLDPKDHLRTICVDSASPAAANAWMWQVTGAPSGFTPGWSGPHCFTVFNPEQPVNTPPTVDDVADTVVSEGGTLNFFVTASDPDQNDFVTMTIEGDALPAAATFTLTPGVSGEALFDWKTSQFDAGVYNVVFRATDNAGATDIDSAKIEVINVNLPPVLESIGDKLFEENKTISFPVTASDLDNGEIFMEIVDQDLPAGYEFVQSSTKTSSQTYEFLWTPTFNDSGVYTATFVASDGQNSDSEKITITVEDVPCTDFSVTTFSLDGPQQISYNRYFQSRLNLELQNLGPLEVDDGALLGFYYSDSAGLDGQGTEIQIGIYLVDSIPMGGPITVDIAGELQILSEFGIPSGPAYIVVVMTVDETSSFVDCNTQNNVAAIPFELVFNIDPVLDPIGSIPPVDEGQTLAFVISATDADGDALEYALEASSIPSTFIFYDSGNGRAYFEWTPNFDEAGQYNLLAYLYDNQGASVDIDLSITVNNVNRPPVFEPIGDKEVFEGDDLTFTIEASDPDDARPIPKDFSFSSIPPLPESFNFNPDGDVPSVDISWITSSDDIGEYLVTFIVEDLEGAADTAIITVTVRDVNYPPAFFETLDITISENDSLELAISAYDDDGDSIVLSVFETDISGGGLIDNGDGTGIFTWYTNNFDEGTHQLILRAESFGGLFAHDTVQITVLNVNQPPVLNTIGSQTFTENEYGSIFISGFDPDGGFVTYSSSTLPTGATFTDAEGAKSFDWTPGFDQQGDYFVTFYVTDDSGTVDSEIVEITVTEVACSDLTVSSFTLDGPQQISYDNYFQNRLNVTLENLSAENVESPFTLRFYYSDSTDPFVDGNTYELGTQTVNSLDVGQFEIEITDSVHMYPDASFGPAYLIVHIEESEYLDCNPDNNLAVIPFELVDNILPVLEPIVDFEEVDEGQTLSFMVTASDADGGQVYINYYFDGPIPNIEPILLDSGNGRAYFEWTPNFNDAGIYDITIQAVDGTKSGDTEKVIITVNNVNRSPVLNEIGDQFFTENEPGEFDVYGFDPDDEGFAVTSSALPSGAIFTASSGGMTFYWTPDFGQSGVYPVTFYITDDFGLVDSEVVTITVTDVACSDLTISSFTLDGPQEISYARQIEDRINVTLENLGPSSVDSQFTLRFYYSDLTDPFDLLGNTYEIGIQTVSSLSVGQFDIAITDSVFMYPDASSGPAYLIVYIDDGNITDCNPENNLANIPFELVDNIPSVLDSIGNQEVNEGETLGILLTASDADGDQLEFDYFWHEEVYPNNFSFTDSGNGVAYFEVTPNFNDEGVYNIEFIVQDFYGFKSGGGSFDFEEITITVNNVNRAPIIDSLPDTLVFNEGDKIGFRIFANDPDDECLTLGLVPSDLPQEAQFFDNGDCTNYGDFSWVPNYGDDGIYHAIFVATDDSGAVGQDTVVLIINNINAPPEFDPISFYDIVENDTLDFQISATDIDGNLALIYTEQLPVGASYEYNGNGTGVFNWTPDCSQSGEYSISYFAADDSGLVDTAYLNIFVGENCNLQLTVVTSPCVQCSPPLAFTDILVSDQSFAIVFNKYLYEGSIPGNISISSARGDELDYDYDPKNKSLIISSDFGQFVPIDTILVTLSTGIYDLDESSLDSNYNLTYTVGPVVYPGDCNNNGIVDEVDVLSIGLYWNKQGPDRDVGGEYGPLDFFAQPAHFQEQGSGIWNPRNAVYADVDGSGMVDAFDLCGIAVNFAKTSYEFATPKGADASSGTASLSGLGSQVLGEMREALIECPESAPKARMLEAIENALRASTVILPTEIELHQNYPNPFNPSTTIEFFLPKAEHATLSIYNMLGQEVITLLDEKVEAGYKEVIWNGKDNSGHQVASGIYFYKFNTESKEIIKRMLLVK